MPMVFYRSVLFFILLCWVDARSLLFGPRSLRRIATTRLEQRSANSLIPISAIHDSQYPLPPLLLMEEFSAEAPAGDGDTEMGRDYLLSAEVVPEKVHKMHNLLGRNLLAQAEKQRGRAVAANSRLWHLGRRGGGGESKSGENTIHSYRIPSESFGSAIKKILMGIH